MPVFVDKFAESRAKSIVYKGKTLIMMDEFPTKGATRFHLVFEMCNSEWRQGVSVWGDQITVNGRTNPEGFLLWQDTAPHVVEFEVSPDTTAIKLTNVWDWGDGVVHSWHNGAAMIPQEIENGRRYFCNDGHPDENFDDLVFRLERVVARETDQMAQNQFLPPGTATDSAPESAFDAFDQPDLSFQPFPESSQLSPEPPISYAQLRGLFEWLDRPDPPPCDHTHRLTRQFLARHDLPVEATVQWLRDNGANCDCEVIFNVTNEWGDKVGWFPEPEDE